MATNKQMEIIVQLITLSLLVLASIRCATFDHDFVSGTVANQEVAHYARTSTIFHYDGLVILTQVFVQPMDKVVKGELLAIAIRDGSQFRIDAPFDGIMGKVYVKYGQVVQVIQPREPLFEIVRKLEPSEGPQFVNDDDDLFILEKRAAGDSIDFSENAPEMDASNVVIETAGKYRTEEDGSLSLTSYLTCDVHVTNVFIKHGQKIVAGQVLMTGVTVRDDAMIALVAPHDGEVLQVDLQENWEYKAGHTPYVMRVELPDLTFPSIQTSQDIMSGEK